MNRSKRLLLFLACLVVGLIVGIVGASLTGNAAWYLAVPVVVAVGWFFVADPTECEPPPPRRGEGGQRDRNAP